MNIGEQGKNNSLSLDMTPLLDVVFLLLIFFVLTTTFASNPGIEVDLPKAASGEILPPSDSIIIVVAADGSIMHESKQFSLEEIQEKFAFYQSERPGASVIIQADETARHGVVIKILDIARTYGFNKLALATEEE